jgi:SAM-dependent methyltransferase
VDPTLQAQFETNRANWDEAVGVHLAARSYDLSALRSGRGRLHPIEEAELGSIDGMRVLHLQCHFGRDTLTLAQRGAEVVGLDFSEPAILTARRLAEETGLAGRCRFVLSNVYQARESIPEAASFDRVFVTWGALGWLPDIETWAGIVAHFLRPGGSLYLAEGHPSAWVFDDEARAADAALPGWFVPYFQREALALDDPTDYADPAARLHNQRTYSWMHPLGETVSALIRAGLTLEWLHEHDCVPWRMFDCLVEGDDGMYRWPEKAWLPLAFSLCASRRG